MSKCDHCGWDISIQPPKESGCNHVHYPEACIICTIKKHHDCEKHEFRCIRCGALSNV